MAKEIKLKYKVKQISNGQWAIFKNAKSYFSNHTYDTKEDAVYASLIREGGEIVDKMDDIQKRLEATGRIRDNDPHAWRS